MTDELMLMKEDYNFRHWSERRIYGIKIDECNP